MCSRSPLKRSCWRPKRRTTARAVSVSGTASTSTGARSPGQSYGPWASRATSPASANPRNRLPTSPIKMRALGKLWGRNPRQAPASASAGTHTSGCPPSQPNPASARPAMAASPQARPSMPSSRFMALEDPTRKNNVSPRARPVAGMVPKRTPSPAAMAAPANSHRSLCSGEICLASSNSPAPATTAAPASSPSSGGSRTNGSSRPPPTARSPASQATTSAAPNPASMASPPVRGTGRWWIDRLPGRSRSPSLRPSQAASGVSRRATIKATSGTMITIVSFLCD